MHGLRAGAVVAALALAATGCVKQLPAAPMPAAVLPAVGAGPVSPGMGRLVIDVVDGPTPIQRVQLTATAKQDAAGRQSYALSEAPHLLCPASPCVLDLPPGNVMIGFPVLGDGNALESELVNVSAEPTVYRRTLSVYQDRTGALRTLGIVGTAVGGAAAVTGIVLLPIGLGKDSGGLTTAGSITLGAGAAVLAFGIWAIRRDAPTYRPGAANHFSF
ncbi:MAG: hypothetical protein R3B06_08080 [Kofleriaceae bacterium]